MPELSCPIRQRGAMVKILVRVPGSPGVFGPFPAYLDTGASVTVLDPGVVGTLGIEPVAAAGLHVLGRDTVSHHGVYSVEVALADAEELFWLALDVLDGVWRRVYRRSLHAWNPRKLPQSMPKPQISCSRP